MIQFFWKTFACPASTVATPKFVKMGEFILSAITLLQSKLKEVSSSGKNNKAYIKKLQQHILFWTGLFHIDQWDSQDYRFRSLSNLTTPLGTQRPNASNLEAAFDLSFSCTEGFIAYPKQPKIVNNSLILYLDGNAVPFDVIAPRFRQPREFTTRASDYFNTAHFKKVPGIDYAKATCFINYKNANSHSELVNKIVRLVVPLLNTQKNHEEKNAINSPTYFDKVIVFGFSLGGNLASHVAHRLQIRYPRLPIQLYTHNSPRSGLPPFMLMMRIFIPNFLSHSLMQFKSNNSIGSLRHNLSTLLSIMVVLVAYLIALVLTPFLTCIARYVLPSWIPFQRHVSFNIEHDQTVGSQITSKYNIKLIKKPTIADKDFNHRTPIYNCYIQSSWSILYHYLHGLKENNSQSMLFNVEALLNFVSSKVGVEYDSIKGEFFETYDSVIHRLFALPITQTRYEQSYVLCQAIEKIQRKYNCCCFFSKEDPLLRQLQSSMQGLKIPRINRFAMSHLNMLKQVGVRIDQHEDHNRVSTPLLDRRV